MLTHDAATSFSVDEVGIDISNHVGAFMSKADLGDRMLGMSTCVIDRDAPFA